MTFSLTLTLIQRMKELNLDDTRLTDDKLKTLAPLIVRFKTVKIGGKQDYGQRGLEELKLYMEQVCSRNCSMINCNYIFLGEWSSKCGV